MSEWRRIARGIILLSGLHVGALFVGTAISAIVAGLLSVLPLNLHPFFYPVGNLLFYGLFFIGISQLLYVIPTIIILNRDRQYALMKGVIIGAIITALLNGVCYIWFPTIL
ncbi:hypothetical protein ACQ4M3_32535 [Leptolyngbya sp. AN03gr2]|uniref:hypothetical protein n=1 Tax=unclassified Leptolyngbya TaxID=2650499 RepID=UPI003D31802A